MNIGQAAAATGVSAKMIRHYEAIGLVPAPVRTEAGYRVYGERDIHTLRFIRRARDLGFDMAQIRGLLALWNDRGRASRDVRAIALTHVEALEERMQQLESMARTLRHLAAHCHGDGRPDCPIIDDLAAAEGAALSPKTTRRRS